MFAEGALGVMKEGSKKVSEPWGFCYIHVEYTSIVDLSIGSSQTHTLTMVSSDDRSPLHYNVACYPLQSGGNKNDRHVFLLDGLIICCKTKSKSAAGEAQYRLKEKINMRKVKLVDLEDTDGAWGSVCVCV